MKVKGIIPIGAAWLLPCLMLGVISLTQPIHYRLANLPRLK